MTQCVPSPRRSSQIAKVCVPGPGWTRIPPLPSAVAEARRLVRDRLGSADPDFVYDVELVTSELVTNALTCVRTLGAPRSQVDPGIWLGVETRTRWTHLRVRDPYPGALPRRRRPDPMDTSGRGVLISAAVADHLWAEVSEIDKIVHAVLVKPGATLSRADIAGLVR
ncbi:ATP-binding protein [Actinoallomurus rhizosphaericola]|uniref:ATP-binding protein n=1 Tax=Actinoallomurus rhizosphaericola TaxID=2952536 RepID=UPI0020902B87|nr:ATP-binding protein [Actinoallomurus rhizosphaericola]MCO5994275.1 ATP-binding protein [Actinoallomurus rhizosphaericola]